MGKPGLVPSSATPRDEPFVRQVGRLLEPASFQAVVGILYLVFAAPAVGVAASLMVLFACRLAFDLPTPVPPWVTAASCVAGIGAFGLSWWPFVRWAVRRRRQACELARNGRLVEGTILRVWWTRGFEEAIVEFPDEGQARKCLVIPLGWSRLVPPGTLVAGAAIPVLSMPGCRWAVAFAGGHCYLVEGFRRGSGARTHPT